jgi:arginyl-tRNA synthetase
MCEEHCEGASLFLSTWSCTTAKQTDIAPINRPRDKRYFAIEAVRISGEDIRSRSENPEEELSKEVHKVAQIVGIGAVKYADLSMNRESNYRFS